MAMSLLAVRGVDTYYQQVHAVKGVSLTVGPAEIVTLIGGNGAGKTTTLKTISGLVRARAGTIQFQGVDITRLPSHKIVEAGVLQVPEGRRIFATLTVDENLDMGAYTVSKHGRSTATKAGLFRRFPILFERRRQLAGTLSGGEQQMLAIARALMASPKLLMLDEPSLGLAPMVVRTIFQTIREINQQDDVAILLVEQNARMSLKVAHKGYVLDRGEIVAQGTPTELLENTEVQRAFLGRAQATAHMLPASEASVGEHFA